MKGDPKRKEKKVDKRRAKTISVSRERINYVGTDVGESRNKLVAVKS